jgi:hypothetical protein
MTWREMVGWGLVASASICDTLAALVKCGAFEALTEANRAHRLRRDGPGALATRAVKGRGVRWYLLLETPTQQPSTPLTYSTNADHPTEVSRWFRG